MKSFTYEDGLFYCNNEKGREIHEVKVVFSGSGIVSFDQDGNRLENPYIDTIKPNNIYLRCNQCSNAEDITNKINVIGKESGVYYFEYSRKV